MTPTPTSGSTLPTSSGLIEDEEVTKAGALAEIDKIVAGVAQRDR